METPAMTDEEWQTLSKSADILEFYGHHDESVAVFRIAERGE